MFRNRVSDGARETVLRKPKKERPDDPETIRDKGLARKYRIADGEQLDAVGLVKRAGGEPEQFVPIVNVALATWLQGAESVAPGELRTLRGVCKIDKTNPDGVDLARIDRGDLKWTNVFEFDASIFLDNRLWLTFEERALLANGNLETFDKQQMAEWKARVKDWGDRYIQPLLKLVPKPSPYVACLVADGDGMGKAIDEISRGSDPANRHRHFSGQLAGFAGEARRIVEQDYLGSLVYSGGDDVLAFLPLPEALACAEALRTAFERIMADACASQPEEARPTLSVGLGLGHVLESMGDLMALGRAAEKQAKGGHLPHAQRRNALAVIVDKRSGGTREWRAQWTVRENGTVRHNNPAKRLREDAALLRGALSTRKVFEIADTLRRLPEREFLDPASAWADMLTGEVERSLRRVDAGTSGGLTPAAVGLDLGGADYAARHRAVATWIDRMLIAKAFADADPGPRLRSGPAAHPAPAGAAAGRAA